MKIVQSSMLIDVSSDSQVTDAHDCITLDTKDCIGIEYPRIKSRKNIIKIKFINSTSSVALLLLIDALIQQAITKGYSKIDYEDRISDIDKLTLKSCGFKEIENTDEDKSHLIMELDDYICRNREGFYFEKLNTFFKLYEEPDGSAMRISDVSEVVYATCNNILVSEYMSYLRPEIEDYINYGVYLQDDLRWGISCMSDIEKCVNRGNIKSEKYKINEKIFIEGLNKYFEWDISRLSGFTFYGFKDDIHPDQCFEFLECDGFLSNIETYIRENLCATDEFTWGAEVFERIMSRKRY